MLWFTHIIPRRAPTFPVWNLPPRIRWACIWAAPWGRRYSGSSEICWWSCACPWTWVWLSAPSCCRPLRRPEWWHTPPCTWCVCNRGTTGRRRGTEWRRWRPCRWTRAQRRPPCHCRWPSAASCRCRTRPRPGRKSCVWPRRRWCSWWFWCLRWWRLGDARPQPVMADRGRTRAAAVAAAAPPDPPPAHKPQTGHRFTRIRAMARPHPDIAGTSTRRRPQPPAARHRRGTVRFATTQHPENQQALIFCFVTYEYKGW